MSDNWLFQHSIKIGQDMVNLRGDNPDQFQQVLEWATANAHLFVSAQTALNGVPPALAGNVTHTQVVHDYNGPNTQQQRQAEQQNNSGWGAPQDTPPPQWSQPAQQAPTCQHGPMVHRSGNKNGKDWSGHFCPTPRGTPNQCQPVFGKG